MLIVLIADAHAFCAARTSRSVIGFEPAPVGTTVPSPAMARVPSVFGFNLRPKSMDAGEERETAGAAATAAAGERTFTVGLTTRAPTIASAKESMLC